MGPVMNVMHESAAYSLVASIAMQMVECHLPLHYFSDSLLLDKALRLVQALDGMGLAGDGRLLIKELNSPNTSWSLTYNPTDSRPCFHLHSSTTGQTY